MKIKEKIQAGICVSELTVDRCPHCVDTCEASKNIPKPVKGLIERNLEKDYARFTFEDLLQFGNYLLSEERSNRVIAEFMKEDEETDWVERVKQVSDLDVEIYFDLKVGGKL